MSTTAVEQAIPAFPVVPTPRTALGTARLVVSRGPATGTEFALGPTRTTLGRRRDNDIPLADSTVSGRHAEIRIDGDRYLIADTGSFNGTYVNRRTIDQAELHDGDELWIGRHRLIFRRVG